MADRIKQFGSHEVVFTNESKEVFPKDHVTKRDLLVYYERVAPLMLPFLYNRPISMHRFVQGIDHEGFYQKNAGDYFPDWIKTKKIAKQQGGVVNYVIINSVESLLYIVNQLCITPHVWLSTIDALDRPDRMVFDLDPSGDAKFQHVRWVARKLRDELLYKGLHSWVMTTGSRGLHVVVPLSPHHLFDEVRTYAHNLALELASDYPKIITIKHAKEERHNAIYIDVLRNSFGQTTVVPYSVRALPHAPIATPIEWSELCRVVAQKYTIKNIVRRITQKQDPWISMKDCAQSLHY